MIYIHAYPYFSLAMNDPSDNDYKGLTRHCFILGWAGCVDVPLLQSINLQAE